MTDEERKFANVVRNLAQFCTALDDAAVSLETAAARFREAAAFGRANRIIKFGDAARRGTEVAGAALTRLAELADEGAKH